MPPNILLASSYLRQQSAVLSATQLSTFLRVKIFLFIETIMEILSEFQDNDHIFKDASSRSPAFLLGMLWSIWWNISEFFVVPHLLNINYIRADPFRSVEMYARIFIHSWIFCKVLQEFCTYVWEISPFELKMICKIWRRLKKSNILQWDAKDNIENISMFHTCHIAFGVMILGKSNIHQHCRKYTNRQVLYHGKIYSFCKYFLFFLATNANKVEFS